VYALNIFHNKLAIVGCYNRNLNTLHVGISLQPSTPGKFRLIPAVEIAVDNQAVQFDAGTAGIG
jgi:hypothetical protein